MFAAIKQAWHKRQLRDPAFSFLFDSPPKEEWVSVDCETTGLDVRSDYIISIGAVKIRGQEILTSERFEVLVRPECAVSAESVAVHRLRPMDVAQGQLAAEAVAAFLRFVGSRPLVGYYLEFDVAMLNKHVKPLLGFGLPQAKIEVSGLYHDYKLKQNPERFVDLRFDILLNELEIPLRDQHDAFNDALLAAMAYVKLRHLGMR